MNTRLATMMLLVSTSAVSSALCGEEILDCCGVIADSLLPPQMIIGDDMPRLAEQATLLFVGRVVKAETSPCCDRLAEVTLRAGKVWKGLGLHTLVVQTGAAADRPFPFAIGQEYLVATLGSQDAKGRYGLYPGFRPAELPTATRLVQALDDWRRAKHDADAASTATISMQASPPPTTLTDDDYAVYSLVCGSPPLMKPGRLLMIQDETSITDWAAHRADTSMVYMAGFGEALKDHLAKVDLPVSLQPQLKLGDKYQITKKSVLDGFIRDPAGRSGGWDGFRKMFPNSVGFVEVSRIGFDTSHNKAVLYVVSNCHPAFCTSQGYYVVADKFDGHWRVFGFLGGRIGQTGGPR